MVSFETYLKAYVTVIPKRAKILQDRIKQKHNIDQELMLSQGLLYRKQVEMLVSIIGEDILFRSAEKRKKQTIRHYLYKFIKSFDFFLRKWDSLQGEQYELFKNSYEFSHIAKSQETYDSLIEDLSGINKECKDIAANLLKAFQNLDAVYKKELSSLQQILKDLVKGKTVTPATPIFVNYIQLCNKEKKLLEQIIGFGSEMYNYSTKLLSMRKLVMEGGGSPGDFFLFVTLYIGGTLLLIFLFGAASGAPAESLAAIGSGAIAFFSPLLVRMRRHIATAAAKKIKFIKENPKDVAFLFSIYASFGAVLLGLVKILGPQ